MTILAHLPSPAQRNIALHVSPAAERAIREGHPWLYENSIREQSKAGNAGDLAIVFDKKDKFMAIGLYDPTSPIRVKILHQGTSVRVNTAFFYDTIKKALTLRQPIITSDTTGYRLIYGEGDSLPGLIIDRYADVLVIKLYSRAWFAHLIPIIDSLNQLLPDQTIVLRLSRLLQEHETYGLSDGMVIQGTLESPLVQFQENGLTFQADVIDGHKTGFFFDQRDNRYRVRGLSAGKRVLDIFSYNGGFSVNAAAGGASHVTSLDISAPALADAQKNMALNQQVDAVAQCTHETIAADVFEGLRNLASARKMYDLVIVDPPTFASSQDQIEGARNAYMRLVKAALAVLTEDGTLVMASCSSRIPADEFFSLVHNTAMRSGYPLREIARTQHALDHPVVFAEGAYLKCLFAEVR
ncbi:MAG: class I SAM-dependent methyltransferase [Phototrophicaceae bacterium]